jgi:hypothetical protein
MNHHPVGAVLSALVAAALAGALAVAQVPIVGYCAQWAGAGAFVGGVVAYRRTRGLPRSQRSELRADLVFRWGVAGVIFGVVLLIAGA